MKTLIVGATGLLGQEMLRASKEYGNDVHVLVRPSTALHANKMKSLQAVGATIHLGDLDDYDSLLRACNCVDNVISAVNWQSGDETILVRAAKDAGVRRLVPSVFGVNHAAAAPGSCLIFDNFASVSKAVFDAGVSYTFIHTGGFFTYWVSTLGDMTKLGGHLPPSEVGVYGDGNVKGAFASESDIACVTVHALNDPAMANKEIHVSANTVTQNELIGLWEMLSGKAVKRIPISPDDLEQMIADAAASDQRVMQSVAQLKRAYWIRGESVMLAPGTIDASEHYSHLKFQTVREAMTRLERD
ncbi:NmrA family NAD(P)-binding protein [Cohnella soli]|uniref:NmrA family NAD(P)-binding protein n=1 Tax=Cohnella soli TaxID=425005 RepID=A0ABW0HTM2_9BACL